MECLSKYFCGTACYPCNFGRERHSSEQKNFVQDEIISEPYKQKNPSEQDNLKQSLKIDVLIDEVKSETVQPKKQRRACDNPVLPDETGFSVCDHKSFMQSSMKDVLRGNVFSDVKSDVLYGGYSVLSQSFVETISEFIVSGQKGALKPLKQLGDMDGLYDIQD